MMSPELLGLPPSNYVVVPETKASHQTFATAQQLPNLPYVGVVGTTASGEPIELYRVTLAAAAVSLNFGFVSDQSASTTPVQLQLFDGSGQALGEWSVGGQGTASLSAGLGALPAGSTLYFGVTAGNSSGPAVSSSTISYQLWISRQSATDQATVTPGPGMTVPASPTLLLGALPLTASTSPGVFASRGNSQAAPISSSNQGGSVGVAVGSPAMRSARPSEGLLSDGDPAPAVASDFNAVVNKEWDERSLNGPTPRAADGAGPAPWAGRENEPDGLVVIPGPGGFPLLGAVAIGHRRRNPAGAMDLGDFATPADWGDGERQDAIGLAALGLSASLENPVAAGGLTAEPQTLHVRPWGGFRVSIVSSLGLATVFTLNAVLSQPIAGFDYLTARLDAGGGPPAKRRERRRRLTAAPQI